VLASVQGRGREAKKKREGESQYTDERVCEPGLDLVHTEGWWRAMDEDG